MYNLQVLLINLILAIVFNMFHPAKMQTSPNTGIYDGCSETINSQLTNKNLKYVRYNQHVKDPNFYYEPFNITVPSTGLYTFVSNGSFDSFGYLYHTSFSPISPEVNLIASNDDISDNITNFRIETYLRSNTTYVLVVTTYHSNVTGSFTLDVTSFMPIKMTQMVKPTECSICLEESDGVLSNYFSKLNDSSPLYNRIGESNKFYYQNIRINVNVSGMYKLISVSDVEPYGYLYFDTFNTTNMTYGLLTETDQINDPNQFLINSYLESFKTYYLVFTTLYPNRTGMFTIISSGRDKITFEYPNQQINELQTSSSATKLVSIESNAIPTFLLQQLVILYLILYDHNI